jgi:hypothetical protein
MHLIDTQLRLNRGTSENLSAMSGNLSGAPFCGNVAAKPQLIWPFARPVEPRKPARRARDVVHDSKADQAIGSRGGDHIDLLVIF